jgi:hypothetical protein
MSARIFRFSMHAAFALSLAMIAAGCDAVVGGSCADGYESCNDRCVPIGGCGGAAGSGAEVGGKVTAISETGPGTDSGVSSEAGGDALLAEAGEAGDGAPGDGGVGSDAPPGGDDTGSTSIDAPPGASDAGGDATPSDACAPPPYDDAANCGACGVVCGGETPVCRPTGASWACAGACAAGETDCGGVCVDITSDSQHCGACGVVCASGLCNGGVCRGAIPGHLVAIGHDYYKTPTAAAARLLTNAAFLPGRNPVRVLAYGEYADASVATSVDRVLDGAAASGRTWTKTIASSRADFDALSIDRFDVVLVYDQPNAPTGTLADVGANLRRKLLSFGEAGGVVIVLDGGSGIGQMPSFLSASTLVDASSDSSLRAVALDVVTPGDAIGIGVLTPYLSANRTVSFTLASPLPSETTVVVRESTSSAPVVLHRVMLLP